MLTGLYRPWVGFSGMFGAHALWAAWEQQWPQVLATQASLARLRLDKSIEAQAAAVQAVSCCRGVGVRYLGPHCIRSWMVVLEDFEAVLRLQSLTTPSP